MWQFYVYELLDHAGQVAYVGKGSGTRLAAQKRNHDLDGREVARFKRERDAYAFEVERIAEYRPPRNVHPGGNGPRSKRPKREAKIMEHTRADVARYLLENGFARRGPTWFRLAEVAYGIS